MAILLTNDSNLCFVGEPAELRTRFNANVNCYAWKRPLAQPYNELSVAIFEYLKQVKECQEDDEKPLLYDSWVEEMTGKFTGIAGEQFDKVQQDRKMMTDMGASGTSLFLVRGTSNLRHGNNHVHHDTAFARDDVTTARRVVCDYTQPDYALTGYRNADVRLSDRLFMGDSPYAPVKERDDTTSDLFYEVAAGAEPVQFGLGTMVAFSFGSERREDAHPEVKPFAHIATPIEGLLEIPRLQMRAEFY